MRERIDSITKEFYDFLLSQGALNNSRVYTIKKTLSSIGLASDRGVNLFLFSHIAIVLFMFFSIFFLSFGFPLIRDQLLLFSIVCVIVGLMLPVLTVLFLRARNRRQIITSVTILLEVACIISELGASIDATILIISQCMKFLKKNHLSLLLDKLYSDLNRMPSRNLAWNNFENQMLSQELSAIIKIISRSDIYGLSTLSDQREQVHLMRELRAEKIQESATKANFMISIIIACVLIPLSFLLIFPLVIDNVTSVFQSAQQSIKFSNKNTNSVLKLRK